MTGSGLSADVGLEGMTSMAPKRTIPKVLPIDLDLLLKFAAIGQFADNPGETRERVLLFVKEYGMLGFCNYCMIHRVMDKKQIIPRQFGNIVKMPFVMEFTEFRDLFFDNDYSIHDLSTWPDNPWIWYHYSERVDWIVSKAQGIWNHMQAVSKLNEAVKSGIYSTVEKDTGWTKKTRLLYRFHPRYRKPGFKFRDFLCQHRADV